MIAIENYRGNLKKGYIMKSINMKISKITSLSCLSALILLAMPAYSQQLPQDAASPQNAATHKSLNIEEMSLSDIADAIRSGKTTSMAVTQAYLDRIAAIDDAGPMLNAVIATMPDALAQAQILDEELAAGQIRGPLHGVPILIKDNIEAK